ncbi:hypothetical protein HDU93_007875, partial [Gonapodya sp. JEL0774]
MNFAGLFVSSDPSSPPSPLPLIKVHAQCHLIDSLVSVSLSQSYFNHGSTPVEALYKFPIYESAAVYAFQAEVDGTVVRGVCKEREDAARDYNTAIATGNRAFLLEEQKADIFQISVGNIPPRKPVLIRISYVHLLPTDEANDELRLVIPTTVASSTYGSFSAPVGTNLLPGGTSYPDNDADVQYTLSLALDIRMAAGPVTQVSSPTHQIAVSLDPRDPKHAVAKLALAKNSTSTSASSPVFLDRDFVLVVKSPGLDRPRAVVERDARSGTKCAMVTFVPKFKVKEAKTEVIFVLDRSGSMSGTNITHARSALLLLLKSLPPTSKFNIIGFGSTYTVLFRPGPVPYDANTLNRAVHHVENVQADLGGTELLKALKEA